MLSIASLLAPSTSFLLCQSFCEGETASASVGSMLENFISFGGLRGITVFSSSLDDIGWEFFDADGSEAEEGSVTLAVIGGVAVACDVRDMAASRSFCFC